MRLRFGAVAFSILVLIALNAAPAGLAEDKAAAQGVVQRSASSVAQAAAGSTVKAQGGQTAAKVGIPISLTSSAEASKVLQMLARMVGFSLVADPTVKGTITISLKSVPFDTAMDLICTQNGWSWYKTGETIVVGAKMPGAGPSVTGANGSSGMSPAAESQPDITIYQMKYADPAHMKERLTLIMPADRVQVDERTRSIVISGTPQETAKARAMLDALDVPISQVSVITRVEEVNRDALKDVGIDWTFSGLDIDFTAGKLAVGLDYQTALRALEQQGRAKSLAGPGVTTLDGIESSVLLGDKVPMPREAIEGDKVVKTVEFLEVGVKLRILPRVNENGYVTMKLTPEISSLTGFVGEYPQTRTAEFQTTVMVKSGQTVAIGGLFRIQDFETIRKTPLLGSLPLIGKLFTSKKLERKESEIVVFVTPYIIEPDKHANPFLPTDAERQISAQDPPATAVKPAQAASVPPLPPALSQVP